MNRQSIVIVLFGALVAGLCSAPDAGAQDGQKTLVYLAGSLTDDDIAGLAESAPNVRVLVPGSREDALEMAPRAHGVDARFVTPEFMDAAEQLVWVQSPSAGVDRYLAIDELREAEGLVLTNMRGVHAPTIAEHSFGMLLTLTRDLRHYAALQEQRDWDRSGSGVEPIALNGRTLCVVGLGNIGREFAKIGKGFGMRVVATRRSRAEPPEYVDEQGTADDLDRFLAESDVVAICLPLTDETRGLFGEDEFATMKPGSYIINIGRGPIVDTDALIAALRSGHLAGACLDVTDPEPLPSDHELWTLPNVFITPHVSSSSQLTRDAWKQTYLENIRRFSRGEELLNIVDKSAGY